MVSAWRNFKNIFPIPLFIIIFRPEMLKFHPYSILTGDIRVEFVINRVLNVVWPMDWHGCFVFAKLYCCNVIVKRLIIVSMTPNAMLTEAEPL